MNTTGIQLTKETNMKVRKTFVSNSSSCSFILSVNEKFNEHYYFDYRKNRFLENLFFLTKENFIERTIDGFTNFTNEKFSLKQVLLFSKLVTARLDELESINPKLLYCEFNSYGETDSLREHLDKLIQDVKVKIVFGDVNEWQYAFLGPNILCEILKNSWDK